MYKNIFSSSASFIDSLDGGESLGEDLRMCVDANADPYGGAEGPFTAFQHQIEDSASAELLEPPAGSPAPPPPPQPQAENHDWILARFAEMDAKIAKIAQDTDSRIQASADVVKGELVAVNTKIEGVTESLRQESVQTRDELLRQQREFTSAQEATFANFLSALNARLPPPSAPPTVPPPSETPRATVVQEVPAAEAEGDKNDKRERDGADAEARSDSLAEPPGKTQKINQGDSQ